MSEMKKAPFDVKIVVAGRTGTGKSTFANLITEMLIKHGIDVKYEMQFEQDGKDIEKKIKALREKETKVEIVEMQYQPKLKRRE